MIAGVTLQQATILSARQDVAAIRSTPVSHKAPKPTAARMTPVTQAAAGIPFPMVPEYSSEPSLVDMAAGRKVVIVTGASSGVGLAGAKALADKGWFVVMANRDYLKSKKAAKRAGIPEGSYCVIHCDLAAFDSVRQFVADFKASGLPLDAMVANAAVYKPLLTEPERTAEGFELCVGTNHLGHFLMLNLLLEDLSKSKNNPRCVILGTVTHNPDELGGKIPPQANLGDLSGMAKGLKGTISMIDGKEFSAPKAYKDSKVCNVLTMKEMHKRFHQSTGVVFSSFYPGCVATTPLFRNHLPLFQSLFPVFHKNVTGAFVSEELAGERLAEVVADPKYTASGSYWTWGGRQKVGRDSYQRKASKEAEDDAKGEKLWDISMELCGLKA